MLVLFGSVGYLKTQNYLHSSFRVFFFSLPLTLSLQPNVVDALWAIITNSRWISSHKKSELYWQLITISETKEHNSTNSYRFRFTIMLFFCCRLVHSFRFVQLLQSGNSFYALLKWFSFSSFNVSQIFTLRFPNVSTLPYILFCFRFTILLHTLFGSNGSEWKLTEYIWTEYS